MSHLLTAFGIEEDFMHLWPTLVQAALASGDTTWAERFLQPVTAAPPGILAPAIVAHMHRFIGLLGGARGDDPTRVEVELRAGIDALDKFGALGLRARAEQELTLWLLDQQRDAECHTLMGHARRTYRDIGAAGWLALSNASFEPLTAGQ